MATATVKSTSTYTPAQEAVILEAVRANGNVANLAVATALAGDKRMNLEDGTPRQPKSITAKLSRMKEAHGFTYERKATTTKDGKPVQKKLDLVAKIAEMAGVTVKQLDGLEKAPKGTLETVAGIAARLADYEAEDEGEREAA